MNEKQSSSDQVAWRDKVRATQGSLRVLSKERASSQADEEAWQDEPEEDDESPAPPAKKSFWRSLWPSRR